MKLKIKDQIPDTDIFQLVDGEPQKSKLREIIGDGKNVLFCLVYLGHLHQLALNFTYQVLLQMQIKSNQKE